MTRAEGQRMHEGQNINSSLSVLGQASFSANGSSCFSMERETEHESEMSGIPLKCQGHFQVVAGQVQTCALQAHGIDWRHVWWFP